MSFLMPTYPSLEVSFPRGEHCWLYDTNHKKYLDALGGIAVSVLGHAHPNIVAVIKKQADKVLHTSNWYQITAQQQLAKKLCQLSQLDCAFFTNSGAESNEAAIKLARLYGRQKNIKAPIIVTANRSFHGRTLATLSASGNAKIQDGFEPLIPFIYVDFGDVSGLKKLSENKNIVAVMLEPIQGEAGIIIPDKNYLNQVRQICDHNQWLLILDEIQTGIGRTGKWFACQHNHIKADIITCAKALANGIPIGACLATNKIGQLFQAGKHGSTFGGNPFATQIALTVLETIEQDNLIENAQIVGDYLKAQLIKTLQPLPIVTDIRGMGLMLAIELKKPCQILLNQALEIGLLINVTEQKNIRLLPPLILNKAQADIIVEKLHTLITAL